MMFKCPACGEIYDYGALIWRCRCGSYVDLVYDVRFSKATIKKDRFNMWRYDGAYPMKYEELTATYDEGMTPLADICFEGMNVKVKLEGLMPTGSFKDRGTVTTVNYLKNNGAKFITEDSSGNAAASVGAYCAMAGMDARIFVPAGNSSGKIMQTAAYGAQVHPTEGTRDQVAIAAQKYEDSYAGHNWHPMFIQGIKSIAYEIWEQMGFAEPDALLAPCGGGALTLGIIGGFKDLLDNGEISRLPRFYAVQPKNCNPVVRAFHRDKGAFIPEPTIAEGAAIARPPRLTQLLDALALCNGAAVDVTEDEIKKALIYVCHKGIYIEPTSAVSFAALQKLILLNDIGLDEKVVVIASGNGLKAGETINAICNE